MNTTVYSLGPSIISRLSHCLVKITIVSFASDNAKVRHAYMIPNIHGKDAGSEDRQSVHSGMTCFLIGIGVCSHSHSASASSIELQKLTKTSVSSHSPMPDVVHRVPRFSQNNGRLLVALVSAHPALDLLARVSCPRD